MPTVHILASIVEIVFIAIVLNSVLSFFWNTKSVDLVLGVLGLLAIFALSFWFELPVLHEIMRKIISVALLAILILFQPELRLALSKFNLRGSKTQNLTEFDHFLEALTHCVFRMSEKRIGAIIAIENQNSLEEFARNGVMLKGEFSSELLESIFMNSTPLHDGAVIIRGSQILAAACILPLAQNTSELTRASGTRHRAGLGLSEITDSLVIIISEESGRVSIARASVMTRGVNISRFKGIVRSIFNPPKISIRPKNIREWLRI